MRNLFFGMLACVAFTACSSDDAEVIEGGSGTFKGDVAYMNIILADASGTRASAAEDPFEYGKDEQDVNTAHFYFYDAAGVFVSEAEVWNSGESSTEDPDENIEFRANTTVVLKGLTGKSYPKYLVTVLNKSTDFAPGTTLDEMEAKIAANDTEGNFKSGNYFTMSTTSHAGQKNSEGIAMKYFVTEVKESNFSEEPVPAAGAENPVTVFVERLAAKVVLDVASTLKDGATKIGEGDAAKYYYPIKATYAGEGNDEEPTMGVENLYVNILGWKLNATAKQSYMMKNIDETWTDTYLGFGFSWNDAGNHRSYWGKSWVYGESGFPVDGATYTGDELLNYFNLVNTTASPLLALGKPAYCAENTNTSYIVSHNPRRALTSVIMKAEIGRIVEKAGVKTFEPLDVVRYNGMLFEKIHFLKYVLNNLQKAGNLTAYYETSVGGETKLTQIDSSFVDLADISDGKVKVVLKEKTGVTLVDKDGNTLSDDAKTALAGEMEKASAGATGYNGGLMYYNIPIEHYNNSENTEGMEEDGTTKYVKIPEAKYGVVRNHVYKVTINQLENPGKGIFDPEEVIVPKDEDEKFYYVGAQINILSWKIVNQGVNL